MYHWDDVSAEDFKRDEDMSLMVALFGLEVAKKFVETFGGDAVYVPKPEAVIRAVRNRHIFNQYEKGSRYRELAARYNLTTRYVREIIKEQKRLNRKITEQQLELL